MNQLPRTNPQNKSNYLTGKKNSSHPFKWKRALSGLVAGSVAAIGLFTGHHYNWGQSESKPKVPSTANNHLNPSIYKKTSQNFNAAKQSIDKTGHGENARQALASLPVKVPLSSAGFSREEFLSPDGWSDLDNDTCNTRNEVLQRDLSNKTFRGKTRCVVETGILDCPYTGQKVQFKHGATSSTAVQIDHVVALSNAWKTGAQALSRQERLLMANDPLNLLAVAGQANQDKENADAWQWLPPNQNYHCAYVARQIAVKKKYHLWVGPKEKTAMEKVLSTCPNQNLPTH